MNRILIIDDDIELCELLTDYLSGEGFSVEMVNDGKQGVVQALAAEYILVILDVMLPEMNGFDVLRKIRESSKVPVIMLTARGDDVDRIVGLELGADDYLPKPFNPRELVARIRAIQRRTESVEDQQRPGGKSAELKVGDIILCTTNRTVKRAPLRTGVSPLQALNDTPEFSGLSTSGCSISYIPPRNHTVPPCPFSLFIAASGVLNGCSMVPSLESLPSGET